MTSTGTETAILSARITPKNSPRVGENDTDDEADDVTTSSSSTVVGSPRVYQQKEDFAEKVGLLPKQEQKEVYIHVADEKHQLSLLVPTRDSEWIEADDIAKMGLLPYLSGMRAVASIAIQVYHICKPGSRSVSYFGSIALSTHFVQGGFLITGALLGLQKSNAGKGLLRQYTHVPRFFFGRWVRLYPALLAMIVITSIWWQIRHNFASHLAKAVFRALFKIQHTKILDIPDDPPNPFAHTWFLDVQEAFYLFWALALPFIAMTGTKARMLIVICFFAFSLNSRMKVDKFNASLTINMWKMIAGASLQLLPIPRGFIQRNAKSIAAGTLIAVTVWGSSAYLAENFNDRQHRIHGDIAGVIATFVVILAAMASASENKQSSLQQQISTNNTVSLQERIWERVSPLQLLNAKWLDFIGRISYSWYLWQIPVMHYEDHFMAGYRAIGSTSEAFIIAMMSTLWFEEPIRDWYRSSLKRAKMAALIAKQESVRA